MGATTKYDDGGSKAGDDLRRRAFEFAKEAVSTQRAIVAADPLMRDVGRQFMRAATSIGANLEEAEAAQSRADFISKCNIALKEAREARYWLRLIAETIRGMDRTELDRALNESRELVAILTSIVRRSRENSETIRDGDEDRWMS